MATTSYRIAFLTDIHANLHGLEAVLAEIRREAPDLVLVGGDLTYKFPFPRETLDLLATVPHQAVAGNTDHYVTEWAAPGTWPFWLPYDGAAHAAWTRRQIGEEWAAALARLPLHYSVTVAGAPGGKGDLLMVHGVPNNPFVGIHHPPGPDNVHPHWAMADAAVERHLAGVGASLILCGHTHVPLIRRMRERTIVNPGAIAHGWPPMPDGHLARWALLTYRPGQEWQIDLRATAYDNDAAVRALLEIDASSPGVRSLAALIGRPAGQPKRLAAR